MVDEVCIDGILEIAALIVREKDIHRFRIRFIAVAAELGTRLGCHAVIEGLDDIWVRCEKTVRLDFFERLRDRLLAKWTADLLQCK